MSDPGSVPNKSVDSLHPQPSSTPAESALACDDSWVVDTITRFRIALLILCGLPLLIGFNGQWRVGLDSALYRGLADALASGRGYHFGDFASTTAYPGLPILLAAVQKVVGQNVFSPWPAIIMILLMSAATLVALYHLLRLYYPAWIATTVVCGLALNSRFVQLSHELLTDIPFLLGTVVSLLGWELLRRARSHPQLIRATVIAGGGLMLAATMRPTFWVIAIAWLAVATVNLFRRRDRNTIAALAIVLLVVTAVFALDPRTRTWRVFEGGYEQELIGVLQDAGADSDSRAPALFTRIENNIPRLALENFPESFLGQGLPWGLGAVITGVLLIGTLLLVRPHPLWPLLVLGTVAVTLVLTTTPRYYLMVMPLLLLGWLLALLHIRRLIGGAGGEVVLLCGLGMVTGMNIAKVLPFIVEQRQTPFLEHYKKGRFLLTIEMAGQIRQHVPPGQRVIGPQAQILRFLSGRDVMMQRELLPPRKSPKNYAAVMAELQIPWGILPGDPYREVDPDLARMIDRRIIRSTGTIASVGAWKLCGIRTIAPPHGVDWRDLPIQKQPIKRKLATTRPKKTPEQLAAAQRREAAARKAAIADRKAATERKEAAARKLAQADRKAAAERKAAAARKAEQEAKRLAAEARTRKEARERKATSALRAEKLKKQQAAEARARKEARERKARKAATQPSTQPSSCLPPPAFWHPSRIDGPPPQHARALTGHDAGFRQASTRVSHLQEPATDGQTPNRRIQSGSSCTELLPNICRIVNENPGGLLPQLSAAAFAVMAANPVAPSPCFERLNA